MLKPLAHNKNASRAVEIHDQNRCYANHVSKINSAKTRIDTNWSHREIGRLKPSLRNMKKERQLGEQQRLVEKENLRLLSRFMEIDQKGGVVDSGKRSFVTNIPGGPGLDNSEPNYGSQAGGGMAYNSAQSNLNLEQQSQQDLFSLQGPGPGQYNLNDINGLSNMNHNDHANGSNNQNPGSLNRERADTMPNNTNSRVPHAPPASVSKHAITRKREQQRIERENLGLLKRISEQKSTVDRKRLAKDHKQQQKVMKLRCEIRGQVGQSLNIPRHMKLLPQDENDQDQNNINHNVNEQYENPLSSSTAGRNLNASYGNNGQQYVYNKGLNHLNNNNSKNSIVSQVSSNNNKFKFNNSQTSKHSTRARSHSIGTVTSQNNNNMSRLSLNSKQSQISSKNSQNQQQYPDPHHIQQPIEKYLHMQDATESMSQQMGETIQTQQTNPNAHDNELPIQINWGSLTGTNGTEESTVFPTNLPNNDEYADERFEREYSPVFDRVIQQNQNEAQATPFGFLDPSPDLSFADGGVHPAFIDKDKEMNVSFGEGGVHPAFVEKSNDHNESNDQNEDDLLLETREDTAIVTRMSIRESEKNGDDDVETTMLNNDNLNPSGTGTVITNENPQSFQEEAVDSILSPGQQQDEDHDHNQDDDPYYQPSFEFDTSDPANIVSNQNPHNMSLLQDLDNQLDVLSKQYGGQNVSMVNKVKNTRSNQRKPVKEVVQCNMQRKSQTDKSEKTEDSAPKTNAELAYLKPGFGGGYKVVNKKEIPSVPKGAVSAVTQPLKGGQKPQYQQVDPQLNKILSDPNNPIPPIPPIGPGPNTSSDTLATVVPVGRRARTDHRKECYGKTLPQKKPEEILQEAISRNEGVIGVMKRQMNTKTGRKGGPGGPGPGSSSFEVSRNVRINNRNRNNNMNNDIDFGHEGGAEGTNINKVITGTNLVGSKKNDLIQNQNDNHNQRQFKAVSVGDLEKFKEKQAFVQDEFSNIQKRFEEDVQGFKGVEQRIENIWNKNSSSPQKDSSQQLGSGQTQSETQLENTTGNPNANDIKPPEISTQQPKSDLAKSILGSKNALSRSKFEKPVEDPEVIQRAQIAAEYHLHAGHQNAKQDLEDKKQTMIRSQNMVDDMIKKTKSQITSTTELGLEQKVKENLTNNMDSVNSDEFLKDRILKAEQDRKERAERDKLVQEKTKQLLLQLNMEGKDRFLMGKDDDKDIKADSTITNDVNTDDQTKESDEVISKDVSNSNGPEVNQGTNISNSDILQKSVTFDVDDTNSNGKGVEADDEHIEEEEEDDMSLSPNKNMIVTVKNAGPKTNKVTVKPQASASPKRSPRGQSPPHPMRKPLVKSQSSQSPGPADELKLRLPNLNQNIVNDDDDIANSKSNDFISPSDQQQLNNKVQVNNLNINFNNSPSLDNIHGTDILLSRTPIVLSPSPKGGYGQKQSANNTNSSVKRKAATPRFSNRKQTSNQQNLTPMAMANVQNLNTNSGLKSPVFGNNNYTMNSNLSVLTQKDTGLTPRSQDNLNTQLTATLTVTESFKSNDIDDNNNDPSLSQLKAKIASLNEKHGETSSSPNQIPQQMLSPSPRLIGHSISIPQGLLETQSQKLDSARSPTQTVTAKGNGKSSRSPRVPGSGGSGKGKGSKSHQNLTSPRPNYDKVKSSGYGKINTSSNKSPRSPRQSQYQQQQMNTGNTNKSTSSPKNNSGYDLRGHHKCRSPPNIDDYTNNPYHGNPQQYYSSSNENSPYNQGGPWLHIPGLGPGISGMHIPGGMMGPMGPMGPMHMGMGPMGMPMSFHFQNGYDTSGGNTNLDQDSSNGFDRSSLNSTLRNQDGEKLEKKSYHGGRLVIQELPSENEMNEKENLKENENSKVQGINTIIPTTILREDAATPEFVKNAQKFNFNKDQESSTGNNDINNNVVNNLNQSHISEMELTGGLNTNKILPNKNDHSDSNAVNTVNQNSSTKSMDKDNVVDPESEDSKNNVNQCDGYTTVTQSQSQTANPNPMLFYSEETQTSKETSTINNNNNSDTKFNFDDEATALLAQMAKLERMTKASINNNSTVTTQNQAQGQNQIQNQSSPATESTTIGDESSNTNCSNSDSNKIFQNSPNKKTRVEIDQQIEEQLKMADALLKEQKELMEKGMK